MRAAKDPDASRRPGYLNLFESGVLGQRAALFAGKLKSCNLCPRECGVDRIAGRLGVCGIDSRLKVAAVNLHPWEEPPISGARGSGTIFFSGCTMRCVFCQNYPISQLGVGRYLEADELAFEMIRLQAKGAHNINLVTPTHQLAPFLKALHAAAARGLCLPIVYNTSGYESIETLSLLEGIVDIYLPDIKYGDSEAASICSHTKDYISHNRRALIEMWRQVGPLKVDEDGIAYRGVLIRHMVLPNRLSGTRQCLEFVAREFGSDAWISLLKQYFPAYQALQMCNLGRKVTPEEYEEAFAVLTQLGLNNGFVQDTITY